MTVAMRAPFSVIEPSPAAETPLVVEIPHAGLELDGPTLANLAAPARAVGRDADLYVDALYAGAEERGATMIVAHVSRYVVDLNRSELDVDAESVEGASGSARATRGIVWRLTSEGAKVLEAPLPRAELERRLDTYYRPYHAAIQAVLAKKKARFGFAILLAAHSMPSNTRGPGGAAAVERADVVPGTRRRTSAAAPFIDAVDAHARAAKLSVAHDDPYQGGYTTQQYGRPATGIHVVQVELARRLYMVESTLTKGPGFERTRAFCAGLVDVLAHTKP